MLLELVRTTDHDPAGAAIMDLGLHAPPRTATGQGRPPDDIVEEWGMQSFPASDPPANW